MPCLQVGESIPTDDDALRTTCYLAMTLQWAPQSYRYYDLRPDLMRAKKALNIDDVAAGGICDVSKMWYPGHALVTMGGRQTGAEWAFEEPLGDDGEWPYHEQ